MNIHAFPIILDALSGLAVLLIVRKPAKKGIALDYLTLVITIQPATKKPKIASRATMLS